MSVYIHGMEMPQDCPYCPLAHWNYKNEFTGCEVTKKYFSTEELYNDGRPNFCPLVPVPPHGDLIDRKTAYDSLLNGMVMTGYQSRALDCISDCYVPTVIPADKEGEG